MTPDLIALAAAGCRFIRVARREKRPLGSAWQTRSTDNPADVAAWIRSGSNVGILLGEPSGVVDVEYDSPDGLEELAAYGITDLHTPTWRSARGQHRLFRWEPWMPTTAVVKLGAIEIRIGGRAAQSVLPPSIHPTGVTYEWTTSPAEVGIAHFPAQLLAAEVIG
jgi:hypothetical protein